MKQENFYSSSSKSSTLKKPNGFTLVEIAIVMILAGLIIGGIFGGIKLIDNSNAQKAAKDLKAIESAALTFKTIYKALPGDVQNPATEIPNCATAPCSRSGDGNGNIGSLVSIQGEALVVTSEKFTMWSHLKAADLIDEVANVDDMEFGAGQMASPLGGGYRLNQFMQGNPIAVGSPYSPWGHSMNITNVPFDIVNAGNAANHLFIPCSLIEFIDKKIDDSLPRFGKLITNPTCMSNTADHMSAYGNPTNLGSPLYIFSF